MTQAFTKTVLVGLCSACLGTGAQDQHSLVVNANVTIVVDRSEAGPVKLAAEDLAADFQKVFGRRPKVVDHGENIGTSIVVGEQSRIAESLRSTNLTAPESFSLSVKTFDGGRAIVLSGADMRGTMYAVYEFSEKYLGVDPMYYWTDHDPPHRVSIAVPESLTEAYPKPVFQYRGFFINDEDLLTGWAPGAAHENTGISLEVWNKIYETILRLKGNMVAPGTWIFPDDAQVKLAAKRGLIVTQHHAIPLGLNVARWPKDVPYNYTTHPEILEHAWRNAVRSYLPDQEVLWSVGLRGLSDVTYASMDPGVQNNNQALGQLISKAIADQMSIVRSVRPAAKFVTNLWQEGARLVQQGDLKIPSEVSKVWADDGYGYLQDHGEVAAGQGIYDHVAMMNERANQLTEMVPVARSFSEIGRYIKAGATDYFLVNTSDIRPVAMSIKAVMDAVWSGLPNESEAANAFYRKWAAEEFGEKAAPRMIELYKQYFDAPAHFGEPVHEYGDQLYHTEARQMLLTYMTDAPLYSIPGQAPKWASPRVLLPAPSSNQRVGKEWLRTTIAKEIEQCSEAQPRWDAVWNKAVAIQASIPVARRPFYQAEVLTMIAINRESNRMLWLVARALRDAQNQQTAAAHQDINQALKALEEIQRQQAAAEYDKWKNWYRGDWLTGVYRTRELVQILEKFLDDPETRLAPPLLWDGWEAYYHIMHYEGDRSADVN